MSWHLDRMALFDTETTGVDVDHDRIVTAAILFVGGGQATQTHTWLINPGIPIPQAATDVHGVTNDHAQAHGADPAEAVATITQTLVDAVARRIPIVGHNIVYDLTILHRELHRHGHTALGNAVVGIQPVIDTMVIDRWADPYRPKEPTRRRPNPAECGSRRLIDTCRVHGITLTEEEAHGAEADALAAGRLAWALARKYPGLDMPLRQLHAEQIGWKAEQAASFGAWLIKQGKPDDVSRNWPVIALPVDWDAAALPAIEEAA
ncbi:exonuclease domain-containing protein [Segeticoccus rhizosphaerae]|uniref:exonuclease domain-containing protein n=1 Tax=Segeticoccus rhizosphaerae TaxID=1104777 RepID=UPI0012653467|nr:exonuclease domain-containing protein [Segeticoccus rhizosphaerae]